MPFVKTAAVIALTLGGFATAAYAADEPNAANCLKQSKEVQASLDSHQQSATYDQAKKALRAGKEFCANGLYTPGLQRFAEARQMLGGNMAGSTSGSE